MSRLDTKWNSCSHLMRKMRVMSSLREKKIMMKTDKKTHTFKRYVQSLLDISIITYPNLVGNGEIMNQTQLLNELSEVAERIAEHRLHAKVELFCLECGDTMVSFTHFSGAYPRGSRSVCLFTFHKQRNLNAWHYQLDKVFEGDLLDES